MRSPEYHTLSKRIKSSSSVEELRKVEKSVTNIYNAGFLSVGEFKALDGMILDRIIKDDR